MGYKYYDTPDGTDLWKKTFYTGKLAGGAGLLAGAVDVAFYSHPKGYLASLGRIGYIAGPAVGMATAFTVTTYTATNLRGKDDRFNYLFGGLAAGAIFGAWRKNPFVGTFAGIVFGIIGVVKKDSIMSGWVFIPETGRPESGTATSHRDYDFTLIPETKAN